MIKEAVSTRKRNETAAKSQENYEPKTLSKFGEWRRANPNGIVKILDMRAVMK
jgi:hypothetical protein